MIIEQHAVESALTAQHESLLPNIYHAGTTQRTTEIGRQVIRMQSGADNRVFARFSNYRTDCEAQKTAIINAAHTAAALDINLSNRGAYNPHVDGGTAIDTRGHSHYYKWGREVRLVVGSTLSGISHANRQATTHVYNRRMQYAFAQLSVLQCHCLWHVCSAVTRDTLTKNHELAPDVSAAMRYSDRGAPTAMKQSLGRMVIIGSTENSPDGALRRRVAVEHNLSTRPLYSALIAVGGTPTT